MTTAIELTAEEIDELKRRTNQPDAASALREVTDRFLSADKYAGLKALCGKIDFNEGFLEEMDEIERADLQRQTDD